MIILVYMNTYCNVVFTLLFIAGPGGDIRSYLEGLAMVENVQKYVEQNPFGQRPITKSNPSWNFYRRVIEDEVPVR